MPHFAEGGSSEPYQAWSSDRQIPMSAEEIEDILLDLTQKFGFQRDSMRNIVGVHHRFTVIPAKELPVRLHYDAP